MSLKVILMLLLLAAAFGTGFGYFLRWIVSLGKRGSMELQIKQMMLEAKEDAKRITEDAEKKSEKIITERTSELKEKEGDLKKTEDRLVRREELLDKRQEDIDEDHEEIKTKAERIKELREEAEKKLSEREEALQQIAGLSADEAKNELLKQVESSYEEDLSVRLQKLEREGVEKYERKAQDIITTAIHRVGNNLQADVLSTTVMLPNEEIKGKIIGKEGRNIRAFERATGVDVIVDDTPGAITISSFDPIRRQVARVALENLMIDGRIQPAKIEDTVEKAREEINVIIKKRGEEAAYEVGVHNLDPKLLIVLGRLHFRTSYGQNVLIHSTEMAHIAAIIAEEVGANVHVARAGALLHDIGKAVDHEVTGTHVEIGRRILAKFDVDPEIIKAMEAHHEEYPYTNPESYIVQVADAISAGRPGARRDTVENYIKRLEELEGVANSFPGIDKSYAISAGREVRIFVKPEEVTDGEARTLARDIALKIESDLNYPGEVKVNVIRESRSIEFAR
ncbi:ribonuclease Y [bacterium]|nr:ribonuclease Y [Parcubacteria group bacterium]MBF05246.1 ribonuclease Y [bacterium]|tara:strand:- start:883 stop:2412 length:1530 start_codon:yes stop_codon:yes gene_type:complete